MNAIEITSSDPQFLRAISKDSRFVSMNLYPQAPNGHKFAVGQRLRLVGLESFPEFNGQEVEVIDIRRDGPNGKAYYVKGAINEFINWIYEYRLEKIS